MTRDWQEQNSLEDRVEHLLLQESRTEDEEKELEVLLQEA